MNVLVFDIETIPDIETGRRLYGLTGMDDTLVAEAMFARRRAESGSDFLRNHLHRVVAIAAVLRQGHTLRVNSVGLPNSSEHYLVSHFFEMLEHYQTPTLVSWNGSSFDLPVLHYRALKYGVMAPRYWEMGDVDPALRWNNYINRYHFRHTDLMDVLALYQARGAASLDDIAILLGLPGKLGMSGNKVWAAYQDGNIEGIRNYCETDVLNTYLIYLRFELMRGHLAINDYHQECQFLCNYLTASKRPHLHEFLAAWQHACESATHTNP